MLLVQAPKHRVHLLDRYLELLEYLLRRFAQALSALHQRVDVAQQRPAPVGGASKGLEKAMQSLRLVEEKRFPAGWS
jgi:hypothetical protein